jgi:outer membrane protein assembly factor BamB
VQFTERGVIGIDGRNGQFLWRYDAPSNDTANVATPLSLGDSVFAASGYGTGGGLVQINRTPRGFEAQQQYFTRNMKNHHGGVVHVDGYLYGCDEQVLTCLDAATGEVMWQDRSCGKCSLLYADGHLIARSERGTVSLVEATPEGFRLKGRFEQPDRSDTSSWPHPVIAHGRLYLRDQDKLFCYDVTQ